MSRELNTVAKGGGHPARRYGFAAMPEEKRRQIAKLGGRKRAEQLGIGGYSSLGRKGGRARSAQLGYDGYVALGKWGAERKRQRRAESFGAVGLSGKSSMGMRAFLESLSQQGSGEI